MNIGTDKYFQLKVLFFPSKALQKGFKAILKRIESTGKTGREREYLSIAYV